MGWLDTHAGSVQALATLVLVALTAYYAWTNRVLVQQTRAALRANARAIMQERLNRVSELLFHNPEISRTLDDPAPDTDDRDQRFHLASMPLEIFEEAHTQYQSERSMTEQDWRAWVATMDVLLRRGYMVAN